MICEKKIAVENGGRYHEGDTLPEVIKNLNSDGIVDSIRAGHWSRHDGDTFIFALCDDCLDNLKEKKTVYYIEE
jgi:hypothetical protein